MRKPIQVYFNQKLVGAFEGLEYNHETIPAEIPILDVCLSSKAEMRERANAYSLSEMMWVKTDRRTVEISDSDIHRVSNLIHPNAKPTAAFADKASIARRNGIPSYADVTRFEDTCRGKTYLRYTWYVMSPTLDQYETLFDHPEFVPL